MDCGVCELVRAVEKCSDCDAPLCGDCTIRCDVCSKPVCPLHIKTTSRGRKLCRPCRHERRAERQRRQEAAEKAVQQVEVAKQATAEEVEFDAPDEAAVSDDDSAMSFASLQREMGEAPKVQKEPDESRPILRASSYKKPSSTSWTLALIFFGVSGIILWFSVPDLQSIMWPWGDTGPKYSANAAPQIKDTNTLRDTGSIDQITLFVQVPFFIVTWALVLAYVFGVLVIVFPSLRILIPRVRERWQHYRRRTL